jgi:hypothetical protein
MLGHCLAASKLSFRGDCAPSRRRTRNPDMFCAKHFKIPGSHFSGCAAFVRPGMTAVMNISGFRAQSGPLRGSSCPE